MSKTKSLPRTRFFNIFAAVFAGMLMALAIQAQSTVPEGEVRFTLMHTNDFHSQLNGLGPDRLFTAQTGDNDPVIGHAARLMTAIRSIRAHRLRHSQQSILLDAGDGMYGTLFHMLAPNPASRWVPEYRFINEAGYDALSLGNHDFDADENGLATALGKAKKAGYRVPFIASNIKFTTSNGETSPLESFVKAGGKSLKEPALQDYLIRLLPAGADQPPLRLGILGLVGPNAAQLCATTRTRVAFIGFNDEKTKADAKAFHKFVQQRVDVLRKEKSCHVVIVLLHGGAPEDEQLAKEVTGIDVIIAGHTHEAYIRKVGTTFIAQTGHGGANLGVLDFSFSKAGLQLLNPKRTLLPVNDAIPAAPDVLAWLKLAQNEIDSLIETCGFSSEDLICTVSKDRKKGLFPDNKAQVFTASTLKRAVNRRLSQPVHLYFSTYGTVRSEFLTADDEPTPYAFSDVFRFSPLGFAPDGTPGAPVVVFSLSRTEVKILLELMTMLSGKTRAYEPAPSSNLTYKLNKFGVPLLNKIGSLKLDGKTFRKWPKRLRIATTLFFAENLLKVRSLTKGIIRITPRDEDGNPITSFPDSGLPREHILLADELRRVENGEVNDPEAIP